MKTSVIPFVLSEDESSRLASCEDKEISIILGDDAYHNLRISLQHAKMLLAGGDYDRIYYIKLPFSGKRFYAEHTLAELSDDKRLEIYHVSSGSLGDTIREIRQRMEYKDELGRAAIIINSWEMGSRSYRHREDLIFAIYRMHMLSEATFFVYSVTEAKQIIMRRSSRAGFGKLVLIAEGLVDLSTGKYRIGKKEEVKVGRYEDETEEPRRVDSEVTNNTSQQDDDNESDANGTLIGSEPIMVGEDDVCVNLLASKINELPIEVGEEAEEMYSMAA